MTDQQTVDEGLLDQAEWPWLADQLEAWPERRVHPERTMSIGALHRMAAAVVRHATLSPSPDTREPTAAMLKVGVEAARSWPFNPPHEWVRAIYLAMQAAQLKEGLE